MLKIRSILVAFILSSTALASAFAATSLSLGADYLLRGVSLTQHDQMHADLDYYDQRLQAYLITDLSQDVEATIRIQSVTPWGLENSSAPLSTRYPNANGELWIQNAFVRLPNIWRDRIVATVGRQPLQWGDGSILSDDDLGFNAIRFQIESPWQALEFDVDAFTAKIDETLGSDTDTDLHGVLLGYDRQLVRWEFMGLQEKSEGSQMYEMGSETSPVASSMVKRQIIGVRARANLRDAYLKGEYYLQSGSVDRGAQSIDLGGDAYIIGLGGRQNTTRFGRFGAVLEYARGSGDKASTGGEDEAFRATYADRWSGLERQGYGRYFAATLSDAYSSSNPFAEVSSTNDGLPPGLSGIQTIHLGIDSTPWSQWTFSFGYFQYKAQRAGAPVTGQTGNKELGTEFDYGFTYRYSGLVTVRGTIADFRPGDAFPEATRQKGRRADFELELRF